MKPWTVTPEEARELTRRAEEIARTGGIPHEEVVQEMLADMQVELRRMVSAYDGKATRSRELLEALVIAEEEGVSASFCAEIRHELAARVRKLRAA
jgi:hypothetical protein